MDVKQTVTDTCECGRELPEPTPEQREGGNVEMVTECPCGNTYVG